MEEGQLYLVALGRKSQIINATQIKLTSPPPKKKAITTIRIPFPFLCIKYMVCPPTLAWNVGSVLQREWLQVVRGDGVFSPILRAVSQRGKCRCRHACQTAAEVTEESGWGVLACACMPMCTAVQLPLKWS
mmetsp:Transcript_39850/g.71371  ORF Transcript_39850/g.71371 Transcript_39850/m.71371 type:complete len:131 (-) Transcript_39850:1563-1955(-)